jgi:hypothetical protein
MINDAAASQDQTYSSEKIETLLDFPSGLEATSRLTLKAPAGDPNGGSLVRSLDALQLTTTQGVGPPHYLSIQSNDPTNMSDMTVRLGNIADPTMDTEAANKRYVDNNTGKAAGYTFGLGDLSQYPSLWVPGQEYKFMDGSYGQRFTGDWTQTISGTALNITLSSITVAPILIDSGGFILKGARYWKVDQILPNAFTTDTSALYLNSWIYADTRSNSILLVIQGNTPTEMTGSYDVWVRYLKEAIATIPPERVAPNLVNSPHRWVVNQEYDFGDGSYGQKLTGSISAGADVRDVQYIAFPTIVSLVNYWGEWTYGSGANTKMSIPSSDTYGLYANLAYLVRDELRLVTRSAMARSNAAYTLWVRYTKA